MGQTSDNGGTLNPLDTISKGAKQFGEQAGNVVTGTAQNLYHDFLMLLHPVDEALGEITGRNLARENAYVAERRYQEEVVARQRLQQQQQLADQQNDLAASSAAGGLRRSFSRGRGSLAYDDTANAGRDYLGL